MMKDIFVPNIGDFDEVEIIEIHVSLGEKVEIEQSLITLESDKATMDIPSPNAGIVKEINIVQGQNVSQGDLILKLETKETTAKNKLEKKPYILTIDNENSIYLSFIVIIANIYLLLLLFSKSKLFVRVYFINLAFPICFCHRRSNCCMHVMHHNCIY